MKLAKYIMTIIALSAIVSGVLALKSNKFLTAQLFYVTIASDGKTTCVASSFNSSTGIVTLAPYELYKSRTTSASGEIYCTNLHLGTTFSTAVI